MKIIKFEHSFYILLIVLFTSAFCHAQSEVTIVGKVKDTNEKVIPQVDVLLKQNNVTQN